MLYNLILLLPSSACLFGGTWLLCNWKTNSRSQNLLAVCVLLSSITFFIVANYMVGITDFAAFIRLDVLDAFVTQMAFPLMYLYFKSLTNESPLSAKELLWFLPALIIGSGTLFLYLSMGEANAVGYLRSMFMYRSLTPEYASGYYQLHYWFCIRLYNAILMLQGVVALTLALVDVIHYHRRLRDFYSTLDDKSIGLNYLVLFNFFLTLLFTVGYIFGGHRFWQDHTLITAFYFVGWAISCFGLCYNGSRVKYTVENLVSDLKQADRNDEADDASLPPAKNTRLEPEENRVGRYAHLLDMFHKLVEEDKIYLRPALRADEVALMMHTNRTYVSRMINEEFQISFSDYINRRRIEYSKALMLANQVMKQQELAERSGFLSASSFCKIFKQETGVSPKEWLKRELAPK